MKTTILLGLCFLLIAISCKKNHTTNSTGRTYRMGFMNFAPRPDTNLYIQALHMWTQRADAAIINTRVPWESLLNGQDPITYVMQNFKVLADYYRGYQFKLWVYIDPANGLNRATDDDALIKLGKSISQPACQTIYRRFCFVMDSILVPEHIGLALETNLIRGVSPDSIYQGIKQATNNAAADIRNYDKNVKMSVSVQVDFAWGIASNGVYQGIAQDLIDFPFIQELGLSSYPYLTDKALTPNQLPLNYYSKLTEGKNLPVFVSEGGWASRNIYVSPTLTINSNPQIQADYINRQALMLDQAHAIGYFQLCFTDIDPSGLPPSTPSNIYYFSYLGLVDSTLATKPALNNWDAIYKRPFIQ